MRKTLLLVLAMSLLVSAAAFGQDFWDPPTLVNRNASGFYYYMLEVPDGAVMTSDADMSDWSWFDPDYVITMEEWRDEGERELPTRDGLDITTMFAWKGAPENRWYVYMTAHDDTLDHGGTTVNRWAGDMIGFCMDPQDHGRDRGNGGYSMEFVAAPGDVNANYAERYPEGEGQPGQAAWLEYGEPPWLNGAVTVDPPEAWAAESWTSDTGGDTVYEWDIAVVEFLEDGGPAVSTPRDLDAMAGEDGFGLPVVLFYEDGDGLVFKNDMTIRGPEGSARQYFAATRLLRIGEYAQQGTAVEQNTWGRIKSSF
jgi:hypothetical protein